MHGQLSVNCIDAQKGNGNYARAVHTRDVNADQTTQELRELRSRLAVCAAAIFHQQKLGKKIVENANYFAGAKDRCQEVLRTYFRVPSLCRSLWRYIFQFAFGWPFGSMAMSVGGAKMFT